MSILVNIKSVRVTLSLRQHAMARSSELPAHTREITVGVCVCECVYVRVCVWWDAPCIRALESELNAGGVVFFILPLEVLLTTFRLCIHQQSLCLRPC